MRLLKLFSHSQSFLPICNSFTCRSNKKRQENGGQPIELVAERFMCIAAAHAYAAEPELFSGVKLKNPSPSAGEMIHNPDPVNDSFSTTLWGALRYYDWIALIPKEARCV